jgi:hypothetical protein
MAVSGQTIDVTIKGKVKTIGFADFKAKMDSIIGVTKAVTAAFDKFATRQGKLTNLMRTASIDVRKAADATLGLITNYDLLQAANRGVALGVELTADKFAVLSQAATVISQKMGTDATNAINDLMVGMGRQSRLILDNLGIIVNADQAYERFAKTLGVTVKQLTESERRTAFQTEAIEQMKKVAGDTTIMIDNVGGALNRLKVAYKNFGDGIGRFVDQWRPLKVILEEVTALLKGVPKLLNEAEVAKAGRALDEAKRIRDDFVRMAAGAKKMKLIDFDPAMAKRLKELNDQVDRAAARRNLALFKSAAAQRKANKEAAAGRTAAGFFGGLETVDKPGEKRPTDPAAARKAAAARKKAFDEANRAASAMGDAQARASFEEARRQQLISDNLVLIDKQIARQTVLSQQADEYAQKLDLQNRKMTEANKASNIFRLESNRLSQEAAMVNMKFVELAQGGMASFNEGLATAMVSVFSAEEGLSAALSKILKSTLLFISKQAAIKAIFYFGEALAALIFNPGAAPTLFAAAGAMTAASAAAGAAGGAIQTKGKSKSAPSRRAGGAPRGGFGERVQRQKEIIQVQVFLSGQDNRGALLLMERRLQGK